VKQEKVGQNGSICFCQVQYVAWWRMSLRVVVWENSEQSCVNIVELIGSTDITMPRTMM